MAITTQNGIIAASRQRAVWQKTTTRTTIANTWFSMFDVAGTPGAGTLAGASTAAGVVPVSTNAGYPALNTFGGGNTGYLGRIFGSNTVVGLLRCFDRVFVAGAYAFNASTTLASQPSYSARLPNTDYTGLELWTETVTAFTGNQSVAVTYTNDAAVAARTTGTFATGTAPTIGRCIQLPLQAGDKGIQKVESVTGTVATVGTFNVMVLRPLFDIYIPVANGGYNFNPYDTGFPQIFQDTSLYWMVSPTSTSSGTPLITMDVLNG